MSNITEEIREKLFSLSDEKYRDFHSALMPATEKEKVIGVRAPVVKKLAKEYFSHPDIDEFLSDLPHKYYEENNLHSFIISMIKDYDECLLKFRKFLPFIDNWATCDGAKPKVFLKHPQKIYPKIKEWLCSEETYSVRFAVVLLMDKVFLEDNFSIEHTEMISSLKTDEYYVHMVIAWYFATALAKQYDAVIPYIENKVLDRKTHNKTIQKSIESYRISDEKKAYLKTLKY